MEHEVLAETGGVVSRIEVAVGEAVEEGQTLLVMSAGEEAQATSATRASEPSANGFRADLEAVRERHAIGLDAARPEAVARRRKRGRRTARENLAELVDEGSYVEYGPLLFAAQEQRRSREELIERTPADGLVAGVGEIDGRRCVAMSYDYTVLAGTQGMRNHAKKDRLFEIARAAPAATGAVRRGRRRATGRRRHADRRGPGLPRVRAVRPAQRPRAARRHRVGLLLCRQRGAARLLRRGDRERGLEHRHGRPGDDRGRRPGRVRAGRGRARSTCRTQTASSTCVWPTTRRRSRQPSATSPTSADRRRRARLPTRRCCAG